MSLIRKDTRYTLAVVVWGLVSAGATILVISGNARPWVSPSALPVEGPLGMFGTAAGLWIAGAFVISRFERRAWRRAGRQANLTPEGGGLFGHPDLVGNVDGRSVRAYTEKRKEGSSTEGGSNKVTYTIVEAALAAPAENGLILGHGDGMTEVASVDVSIEGETVGDVSVVGDSKGLARDVVTGRVQDALRQPARTDSVLLGDASDVILEAVPDMSGAIMGRVGDKIAAKLQERIAGDAGTVATECKGTVLDGTELARQVEAVVAVANAYEAATADRPAA